MKRFTTVMYDVATDFEQRSWIAADFEKAETIRESLRNLDFQIDEENIPDGVPLFDLLIDSSEEASRTLKTHRTAEEVLASLDNNVALSGITDTNSEKLDAFMALADGPESLRFQEGETNISVTRVYSPSLVS